MVKKQNKNIFPLDFYFNPCYTYPMKMTNKSHVLFVKTDGKRKVLATGSRHLCEVASGMTSGQRTACAVGIVTTEFWVDILGEKIK
tara:strand:- start:47 stop:304 length:258 start_codon:yes stop_codon:yes gene_type:complete